MLVSKVVLYGTVVEMPVGMRVFTMAGGTVVTKVLT